MRDQIPRTPAIQVLEGNASTLSRPDESADAAWLSLVIHHIPDLGVVELVRWFRQADTTMRNLTEDEFLRGKERLRRAVRHAEDTANPETRSNWLDLLILR